MKLIVSPNSNKIKPLYSITEDGIVYNHKRNRILKQFIDRYGYKLVGLLCEDGKPRMFFVHRLVLAAYAPCTNMADMQVNHKDGNKSNNTVKNLEWCTLAQNKKHAVDTGLWDMVGEKHFRHLITDDQAKEIRKRINAGEKMTVIARTMNVPYSCVANIKNRNYYRNAV